MNKANLLSGLSGDEKILISHVMDLAKRCDKVGSAQYSPFLNPREIKLALPRCKGSFSVDSFGGHDGAERKMLSFCPFDDEPCYPICSLKIVSSDGAVHSHRDYLGAILSLGIKREKLGDIVTCDDCAVVFCDESIADFISMNLIKVASSVVTCSPCEVGEVNVERKFSLRASSVASLRLDAVLASAIGKSRETASELIGRGLVQVNYDIAKSVSARVESGDVISARGFGKMIIETDCSTTKKGRIKINIKQFV